MNAPDTNVRRDPPRCSPPIGAGAARAGRRHGVSRPRDRRRGQRGRRSRVQHGDDRLPGNPDRSVVCRPDRHAHLSAHRQHGRQRRGRRVAAHLRRGTRDPRPAAPGVELAHARTTCRRLSARQQRRRHRRPRHAQADARPAREGRAERLHRRRRRRSTARAEADAIARARAAPSMAGLDLAKVVSCTQPLRVDRRARGRSAAAIARWATRASTSSRTTTASSTTSCACWRSAAAASPSCRRRRRRATCSR